MGNLLKKKLIDSGWIIKNETGLPVVCFTDNRFETDFSFTKKILNNLISSGRSWLSVYPVKEIQTFRACITNYNTTEEQINELVDELNEERKNYIINRNALQQTI